MRKSKSEDQKLLRAILGHEQFIMLNKNLCKKIGLLETIIYSNILNITEYELNINPDALDKGIKIYRASIEEEYGLSPHKQRKIEKSLVEKDLITIREHFNKETKMRYNIYLINLDKIEELLQP
jgi:hypothetical protein